MSLDDLIRWFFGRSTPAPLSAAPEPAPEPQFDKDTLLREVHALAASLNEGIDELARPTLLEEMDEFRRAVDLLQTPCFTNRELLQLHEQPQNALWQLGVKAVAGRAPDADLVEPLLEMFSAGGPWQDYFVLQALLVHTPMSRSLAGDVFYHIRFIHPTMLHYELAVVTPTLIRRSDAGEHPTFGPYLAQLDKEGADGLETVLGAALKTSLKPVAEPLQAEVTNWRETFSDTAVLRAIGRIWDRNNTEEPPLVDHPQLERLARDVERLVQQTPRRPVLVTGEHGVGKTAVVRLAARRLMEQGWCIFEAAGADLIAGQKYIGSLEQRLKDLLQQIEGRRKVVWYVPDFQTLGWIGTHEHSRSGVIDLLMPHLEAGTIAVIGELPAKTYEQLGQDRPRLKVACEVCRVAPLAEPAALRLATDWAATLGPDLLPAPVLEEAWLLARQYLRDREAPGCLLDFLAQAFGQQPATAAPVAVTRDHLLATLATMTSLPPEVLDERLLLDTDHLRAFFGRRILGQPEAVACLIERITLIKAGLTDPGRPQGVFLFAGPTGTGKTEIAKALATYLFGSEERLLRYDMSEFQAVESLERLVGDGRSLDRDSLALKIRKQPFAVILLDEFEKAHPKVWDLFLQVFDDGRLTDPMGRTSDFRHAIVILTSNLGGQAATAAGLGFDQDGASFRSADVDRAVAKAFRPEFLNRLDRVVVFRPFSREVMREILDKELRDVQRRRGLRNRSWAVVWEDSALEFLLDRGFSPTLGARPLKRAVDRYLLTPLAEIIVRGRFPAGDQFLYIQGQGDRLSVDFIDPQAEDGAGDPAPADVDDPCTDAAGAATCLAAIALHPAGTAEEFARLQGHLERLREHLRSPAWTGAKSLALSMSSLPGFWNSPERFAVLGEVECRERVETGLDTAGQLVAKIAGLGRNPERRHPRKLVGQAAERLHLLDLACRSIAGRSAWDAVVQVESKREPMSDDDGADILVERLGGMYRQWGQRRKLKVLVLEDIPRRTGRPRTLLLGVSGYAAFDILAPEAGLHVWEEPTPGRSRASLQHKALVRVVPLPDDAPADGAHQWLQAGRAAMKAAPAGAPAVVRIYRERPDPLVKDRGRGWRTGRLDRVLAGDFDLLGACVRGSEEQDSA